MAGDRRSPSQVALRRWPRCSRGALPPRRRLPRRSWRDRSHRARSRRYTDAIALDATDRAAYLGLGALRLKDGDPREAENVYALALVRIPDFTAALLGRAEARWVAGDHPGAEQDLAAYAERTADPRAYARLGSWYASDGLYAVELALYRRLAFAAAADSTAVALVRALVVLVGPADPATHPPAPTNDATRRSLAHIARRLGM